MDWLIRSKSNVLLILCLLLAGGAAQARGNQDVRDARQHYQRGEAKFKEGNYEAALNEFKTGYSLVPRSEFLLNIGQCLRRMGKPAEARDSYLAFLEAKPDSPLRADVEVLIRQLEGEMQTQADASPATHGSGGDGTKAVASAGDADSADDDPFVRPTPPAAAGDTASTPPHFVAPAQPAPPSLLTPPPAPAPVAPPSKPFYTRWQTWVIAAGVAVALGSVALLANRSPEYDRYGTVGTLGAP